MEQVWAGADALVLLTEWTCYRGLGLAVMAEAMSGRALIDLRNVYEQYVAEGVGWFISRLGVDGG